MALNLIDIEIKGIGKKAGSTNDIWCTLVMGLGDGVLRHELVLRHFVKGGDLVTIGQIRTEARDRAKTILAAALAYLEEHDIDALEGIAAENWKTQDFS